MKSSSVDGWNRESPVVFSRQFKMMAVMLAINATLEVGKVFFVATWAIIERASPVNSVIRML